MFGRTRCFLNMHFTSSVLRSILGFAKYRYTRYKCASLNEFGARFEPEMVKSKIKLRACVFSVPQRISASAELQSTKSI